MRRGTCLKCGETRIRHLEHVIDAIGRSAWSTRYINKEYRALGGVQRSTGILSTETHLATVEAFVCTACGYFEEYVKDPARVPWEELPLSRWV